MQVSVVEEDKERLKVEVKGESPTITQLVASQVWKEGGEAAPVREHPFMVEPKILIEGSNPKKLLEKAAKAVEEQADELKEELKKALKEAPSTVEPVKPYGIRGPEEFEERSWAPVTTPSGEVGDTNE
jgi:DNA-directed RNA polymerase subunit L